MQSFSSVLFKSFVCSISLILSSCGSDSGGGSNPSPSPSDPPVTSFSISGKVNGLNASETVTLKFGYTSQALEGSSDFEFFVEEGQRYIAEIKEQPLSQRCWMDHPTQSGIEVATHIYLESDVSDILVTCRQRERIVDALSFVTDDNLRACIEQISSTAGYMYTDELEEIDCEDAGVSSIWGIEKFPYTKKLDLSGNAISNAFFEHSTALQSLNLSSNGLNFIGVTKLKALKGLSLAGNNLSDISLSGINSRPYLGGLNLMLNPLESVDISGLPFLRGLYINEMYKLTEIDLSQNKNHSVLWVFDTPIEQLDLSGNSKLGLLEARDTSITELDLTNNNDLYSLDISNTAVTELDVAHLDLGDIDIDSTEIEVLDLSSSESLYSVDANNTALRDLIFGESHPLLEYLRLSSSQIEEIDTSNLKRLRVLNLSDNNISAIDVRQNINLTVLILRSNNISDINLSKLESLDSLWLNDNRLNSLDFSNNSLLEFVNASENQLVEVSGISSIFSNNAYIDLTANSFSSGIIENLEELKLTYSRLSF